MKKKGIPLLDMPAMTASIRRILREERVVAAKAFVAAIAAKGNQGKQDESPVPSTLMKFVASVIEFLDYDEEMERHRATGLRIVRKKFNKMTKRKPTCIPTNLKGIVGDREPEETGEGMYGKVYRIGQYAVKIVDFKNTLTKVDMDEWRSEVEISILSGDIGVGPKIHEAYACILDGEPNSVIVMDHVEGVTFADWREFASKDRVAAAEKRIVEKMAVLHAAGIHHGDLHGYNIIVTVKPTSDPKDAKEVKGDKGIKDAKEVKEFKGVKEVKGNPYTMEFDDVWVIDYGLATTSEMRNNQDMRRIKYGRPPEGMMDSEREKAMVTKVGQRLIAEGLVIL
jgi:predicted Ser/Thr protein kinase